MKITRDLHDRCNARFFALRGAHPDINMRPSMDESLSMSAAQKEAWKDLMALSAVASSFATGDSPRAADRKRAMKLLGE